MVVNEYDVEPNSVFVVVPKANVPGVPVPSQVVTRQAVTVKFWPFTLLTKHINALPVAAPAQIRALRFESLLMAVARLVAP